MGIDTTGVLVVSSVDATTGQDSIAVRVKVGSTPGSDHGVVRIEFANSLGSVLVELYQTLDPDVQTNPPTNAIYSWALLGVGSTSYVSDPIKHGSYQWGQEFSIDFTVTPYIRYPARKCASIYQHDRYGLDGLGNTYDWGYYFLSSDTDKTVDVSPYFTNAHVRWTHLPFDGDVTVGVTVNGEEHTLTAAHTAMTDITRPTFEVRDMLGGGPGAVFEPKSNEFDETGNGNWTKTVESLRVMDSLLSFDDYTNEQTDGPKIYRTVASGNTITMWSNADSAHIGGDYAPDDNIELQAKFVGADGSELPDSLTVSAYSAPGQPPSAGDDWESMPILEDLTFSAPGTYTRALRHYDIEVNWMAADDEAIQPDDGDLTCGIAAVVTPGSLDDADLDMSAWRYPLPLPLTDAAWYWLYWYKSRAAYLIDACTSTTGWTAGGGGSVSVDAGKLKLAGSANKTLAKTFAMSDPYAAGDASFATCRYLTATFTGGGDATLDIGTKQWDFTATGTVTFDLCNPSNASGADECESRFGSTESAWGWGVEPGDSEVVFTFTTASDVTVDTLLLDATRGGATRNIQLDHTWQHEALHEVDGYGTKRRGVLVLVDGKAVLDEPIGEVEDVSGGARDLPDAYTFNAVVGGIEARLGLDGNDAGPLTFARGTAASPPAASADETDYGFTYGFRHFQNEREAHHIKPLVSSYPDDEEIVLPAHFWADRIQFGPGACSPITTHKVFGGNISGLVCDHSPAAPAANVSVTCKQESTTTGTARTNEVGFYNGPLHHRANTQRAELTADASVYGEDETMFHGRRMRVCLEGEDSAADAPDCWIDPLNGRMYIAYQAADDIAVMRSWSYGKTTSEPRMVGEPPAHSKAGVDYAVADVVAFGGGYYRCKVAYTSAVTDDAPDADSTHWAAVTFAPKLAPCVCGQYDELRSVDIYWSDGTDTLRAHSSDGFASARIYYVALTGVDYVRALAHPERPGFVMLCGYDSANSKVVAARSFDGGLTVGTPVDVCTTAADTAMGLALAPNELNTWVITLKKTDGTVVSYWSHDSGLTWAAAA